MLLSAEIFFAVNCSSTMVSVLHPRCLRRAPDAVVPLGEAPDGLPMAMQIRRKVSVADHVLRCVGVSKESALQPPIRSALGALELALREQAVEQGLGDRSAGVGSARIYRTQKSVSALLGSTMMVRLLKAQSPLSLTQSEAGPRNRYRGSSYDYEASSCAMPERVAATCAAPHTPNFEEVLESMDKAPRMLLPLNGDLPMVAKEGWRGRAARFESLQGFPSARFKTAADSALKPLDRDVYERAVSLSHQISWSVSRADVGESIVALARDVGRLHAQNKVHCDLKPANVLVTSQGPIAFDGLNVDRGGIAPGATPGWAAPEQILARPVTFATDVFALGLFAARLFGAAIYGEERSFLIPTGGASRKRIRLLAEPSVFIDPRADVRAIHRQARERFIAKCLAFEPEDRPQDTRIFADTLAGLLCEQPPVGRLSLAGGPGTLNRNVEHAGRRGPAWVVSDDRYTGRRSF